MNIVIIGNSAAAIGAVEAIREENKDAFITIISDEAEHTYGRPLISYLLCGKTDEERMRYRPADFYEKNNVRTLLGRRVQRIDAQKNRDEVSIIVGGSIRSSADIVKAIALGADAVYIATGALLAMGCHLCRTCHTGKCNWGIATQRPDLVRRLNPDVSVERLKNLLTAWNHEICEMMGGMGINSIEALRGNRLMLRGVGLNEKELSILGVKHAGE